MKYLKVTIVAFLVTASLAAISANASGHRTYINVQLPKFAKTVTYGPEVKDDYGYQWYKSNGTVDMLTSADVNVVVKKSNPNYGTSAGLVIKKDEIKTWGNTAVNTFPSNAYEIIMRREKSAISKASHTGSWLLDEKYVEAVS